MRKKLVSWHLTESSSLLDSIFRRVHGEQLLHEFDFSAGNCKFKNTKLADFACALSSVNHFKLTKQCMETNSTTSLKDGDECKVTAGTHAGKTGTVTDIHTSKTGQVTITVVQKNGLRFKTLARNVVVIPKN